MERRRSAGRIIRLIGERMQIGKRQRSLSVFLLMPPHLPPFALPAAAQPRAFDDCSRQQGCGVYVRIAVNLFALCWQLPTARFDSFSFPAESVETSLTIDSPISFSRTAFCSADTKRLFAASFPTMVARSRSPCTALGMQNVEGFEGGDGGRLGHSGLTIHRTVSKSMRGLPFFSASRRKNDLRSTL